MPKQDIAREKEWWDRGGFYVDSGHWTSGRIFASRERHWLCTSVSKIRFYSHLIDVCRKSPFWQRARVLLAPTGDGADIRYLRGLSTEIHGIDISPVALGRCPRDLIPREGDIGAMPYDNEFFDVLVCALFLHHVHRVGFTPYLKEFHRVLKPGGVLAIQEPSALFPPAPLFAFLRRLMGNITGQVPAEKPLNPKQLKSVLRAVGFRDIHVLGLGYNHVRTPVVFQLIVDAVDAPFRRAPLLSSLCYNVGFYARK